MARPAETCAECRALVAADQMTLHLAWHAGLSAALAGHPHGALAADPGPNHPHGPVP
jgi:hypothetical protein